MTPGEADAHAAALLVLGKRIAAKIRVDPGEAHAMVGRVPPEQLPALVCVLAALVPPGPVDAWWQRTTPADVYARRRAVLLGEVA